MEAPNVFSFAAHLAAHNSLLRDVVNVAAKELGVTEDAAIATMCQHDTTMSSYQCTAGAGHGLHRALAELKEGKSQRFIRATAAHVHAANLATASALIMRWSILDLRRIEEPSDNSPQRHKQPPPLGQMVITGGGLEAL